MRLDFCIHSLYHRKVHECVQHLENSLSLKFEPLSFDTIVAYILPTGFHLMGCTFDRWLLNLVGRVNLSNYGQLNSTL